MHLTLWKLFENWVLSFLEVFDLTWCLKIEFCVFGQQQKKGGSLQKEPSFSRVKGFWVSGRG
ncbi:unnamed protein product [Prunus brigantina]